MSDVEGDGNERKDVDLSTGSDESFSDTTKPILPRSTKVWRKANAKKGP
ncbi:MAG: hypothetical protein MUE75_10765 [Algoriphagus sp.]|nr:hypothetical protein [Algoriphagus sp.]